MIKIIKQAYRKAYYPNKKGTLSTKRQLMT